MTEQTFFFTPNHNIVADRAGHSFIYENSTGRITLENQSRWRYQALRDRIAAHQRPFTADKVNNACANLFDQLPVMLADATSEGRAFYGQMRTVWHCLYDQQAGTVAFSFYLGEDVKADGTCAERRSE